MKKLISNQTSPNFTLFDSFHAFFQIVRLWSDKSISFEREFGTENYRLTNAARTAIRVIIEAVKPDPTKKIGIPAFCCAVMATPFLEKGYEICWIDTDENGVLSVEDFRAKSENLSMVLVPHIFGIPAPLGEIRSIAKEKGIFVIEDGAHLFDTDTSYCDAKILSFGREKVFSCVSGGALLWPEDSPYAGQFQTSLFPPKKSYVLRHLLQPFIFAIALPLWNIGKIGKGFAWAMRRINLLPRAVTPLEKKGFEDFPRTSLAIPLQHILKRQLKKRTRIERHRKIMALYWKKVLDDLFPEAEIIVPDNYFRVILKSEDAQEIKKIAKSWSFDLREWEGKPISPEGVLLEKFGYNEGDCPRAEYFSQHYVTFPTNVRTQESDIETFKNLWKLTLS